MCTFLHHWKKKRFLNIFFFWSPLERTNFLPKEKFIILTHKKWLKKKFLILSWKKTPPSSEKNNQRNLKENNFFMQITNFLYFLPFLNEKFFCTPAWKNQFSAQRKIYYTSHKKIIFHGWRKKFLIFSWTPSLVQKKNRFKIIYNYPKKQISKQRISSTISFFTTFLKEPIIRSYEQLKIILFITVLLLFYRVPCYVTNSVLLTLSYDLAPCWLIPSYFNL